MERRQEAIATAREAINIDPDYIYSYHVLAIAHAERGEIEEARAATENILRIEPKSALGAYDRSQPFQDEGLRQRMIDGLRKAGLPD
jgi:tetratricopeptide (TPR) repeat protein